VNGEIELIEVKSGKPKKLIMKSRVDDGDFMRQDTAYRKAVSEGARAQYFNSQQGLQTCSILCFHSLSNFSFSCLLGLVLIKLKRQMLT
jgi:hypothetical protein